MNMTRRISLSILTMLFFVTMITAEELPATRSASPTPNLSEKKASTEKLPTTKTTPAPVAITTENKAPAPRSTPAPTKAAATDAAPSSASTRNTMLPTGGDLDAILARGELRHLGIPYANFVTGSGDGLDVELMERFAKHLGVTYVYVETTWPLVFQDLLGSRIEMVEGEAHLMAPAPIRGDIISSGLTRLAWREKIVAYSTPVFPTQVWLLARAESLLKPIKPTGDEQKDIAHTKLLLKEKTVMGKVGTCLEPQLYDVVGCHGTPVHFPGQLNDLAPALIKEKADLLLLDVPDCLIALRKWPGAIKVLGPISGKQDMGCAFRKDAPKLRAAFNAFLATMVEDGSYLALVQKYYPDVPTFFPAFFQEAVAKKKVAETHTTHPSEAKPERPTTSGTTVHEPENRHVTKSP